MAVRAATQLGRRLLCSVPPPAEPVTGNFGSCKLPLPSKPNMPPQVEPVTSIFVSGLSTSTTSKALREAFSEHGKIHYAQAMRDLWVLDGCLGFGYVRYATIEEAAKSINSMNGKLLDGSRISVEYARPRTPAELRSSVVPWRWSSKVKYF